jgi:hypothetical protein
MDDQTLTIISSAIIVGIWIAFQLAQANKVVKRAFLPDTWQELEIDRKSDSNLVPDFSTQYSQIQKRSDGDLRGGINNA